MLPSAKVIAVVRADALKVPMFHAVSIVIVPVTLPVSSNTAVSWASGKLLMSGVPPDPGAQAVALHCCAPARFQYAVLGAGNVMPVLPPQSPARVGDAPDAAPARVISRKSQSVAEMALTVSVRGVPMVSDRKKMRRTAEAPAQVKVPLTVWFAEKVTGRIPKFLGVIVMLLKVTGPLTLIWEFDVFVVEKL